MTIKHTFTSPKADSGDTTLVQPSNWNADHDLSGLVAADVTDFNTAVAAVAATASFVTISVSGQSDVVADMASDTLTLVAGTNVTITTDAATDTITIDATSGGVIGSDTQIPFNDAGTMAGDAHLTWDKTGVVLTIGTTLKFGASTISTPNDSAPTSVLFQVGSSNSLTLQSPGASVTLNCGTGSFPTSDGVAAGDGGSFAMQGGAGGSALGATDADGGTGGDLFAYAGNGGEAAASGTYGNGGVVEIGSGSASGDGNAGSLSFFPGTSADGAAGDIVMELATASGAGTNGNLLINNLPSSDPGVPGAVYQSAGILMVSL